MSGHSKWNNIKNRKGAQDKKRSALFTRASRNILIALRTGSGLDGAISRAKEINMPKENIDRVISKFNTKKDNLINFFIEGFISHSVPVMVEIETDNRNRILAEVKLFFKENNGVFAENGSVSFGFDRVGEIELENNLNEEKELELIDIGLLDYRDNCVYCKMQDLKKFEDKLGVKGELIMQPKMPVMLNNESQVKEVLDFVERLEENEDIVNVFAGFDYEQKN
jgi:YebC/PmpR family DNA-binding regulatory protein